MKKGDVKVKKKGVQSSKAKNVILTISIALVSVFFIAYAIQAIYPAPEYSNFCEDRISPVFINDSDACNESGGRWNGNEKGGYCDNNYECNEEYGSVRDTYERNVFFINLSLGLVIIVLSLLLVVESVSTGFMAGGTILLVYGTIRYWSDLDNVLKTLMLGAVLGVLIWLGYKKLK